MIVDPRFRDGFRVEIEVRETGRRRKDTFRSRLSGGLRFGLRLRLFASDCFGWSYVGLRFVRGI